MRSRSGWVGVLGFGLGVACTLVATSLEPAAQAKRVAAFDRKAFDEALRVVLDRYVDPIDESQVLARALKHVVAELDPHSTFLTAGERGRLLARADRGATGISAVVHEANGKRSIRIVSVEAGSPADRAGLRAGDRVLAIGSLVRSELSAQAEIDAALLGKIGETVSLRVQRTDAPLPESLELPLERIEVRPVEARLESPERIGVIRIRAFAAGVGDRVKQALADLQRQAGIKGLGGIVLDLRSNPGGEVHEALVVADLFVAHGLLTRTRGRGGRILREERAHEAGTDLKTPLVVLQDRHSASAAELLAAALQENGRAQVIGERSFGKGTVQELMGQSDGSMLALTIARYYSPLDRAIEGVGIEPDVAIPLDGGDAMAQSAAIAVLAGGRPTK